MIKMNDDNLFLDDDVLLFEEEHPITSPIQMKDVWKILIVDDEPEIHQVTKMVLDDFIFDNRTLQFFHAYSGEEAIRLMEDEPDIAIILLDVVMEKDDAGLRVVKHIREIQNNKYVRIILRTGQPGQAPEKQVILAYDINDYKEKTELTSQKLFTTIIAALRSYRDITIIESNKQSLEMIIKAAPNIFKLQSMQKFAAGVLEQLTSLLHLNRDALHCNSLAVTCKEHQNYFILAGTGIYEQLENANVTDIADKTIYDLIEKAFLLQQSFFDDEHIVCYFQSTMGADNVIYLHGRKNLTDLDRSLISIYCSNVSVAFENLYLNDELENTQREIIFTLGEIAETRSQETGFHVKRVAEFSKLLALRAGLSEEEAEILRLSSPMHDVGKVGVPDNILNKPGRLTPEEFEQMKMHAQIGYDMLKGSKGEMMKVAAIIAKEHHEKYDGTGYPEGLSGEDIHLYARIVAIADVFDALSSERIYKPAWSYEQIKEHFKNERGKYFDPILTDTFLSHYEDFIAIREKYSDVKVF